MFNHVKARLATVFSLSLLLLLLLFIGLLYFFISHEINDKEVDELEAYFQKEKMDFIEDLYEKDHHGLETDVDRSVFYYVFTRDHELSHGKEAIQGLDQWVEKHQDFSLKKMEWQGKHLLLLKKSLDTSGTVHGTVILGLDITSETHLVQNILVTLLVMTAVFSLFYAFMGYYFAGQAMIPIKRAFSKQEKFVSDASHELRTPLSIFFSSVDLLMREEKENLSHFGVEVLGDIKAEADLMNNLINSLLFLARSDQNQLELEKREFNLSELSDSVFIRFFRKNSSDLQFKRDVEKDILLIGDEMRIQQLLYILLDNAFRYTKEGCIFLSLKMINGKRVISISDTGCGISPNELPFIFDRFYRSDLSRKKGGNGLGLSIAKAIVSAHGGEIKAESRESEGTRFTVSF